MILSGEYGNVVETETEHSKRQTGEKKKERASERTNKQVNEREKTRKRRAIECAHKRFRCVYRYIGSKMYMMVVKKTIEIENMHTHTHLEVRWMYEPRKTADAVCVVAFFMYSQAYIVMCIYRYKINGLGSLLRIHNYTYVYMRNCSMLPSSYDICLGFILMCLHTQLAEFVRM